MKVSKETTSLAKPSANQWVNVVSVLAEPPHRHSLVPGRSAIRTHEAYKVTHRSNPPDNPQGSRNSEATVVLQGATVNGNVNFRQDQPDGPVQIRGRIQGLDPSSLRGFHVHEFGNLTDGCTSAGAHYNPFNTTHGAPTDSVNSRHVGDLGNVQSDENGVATLDFRDEIIKLEGPLSIIGRAVVVHTGTDDLGRGGTALSLTTGNAGDRAACGVIELTRN